LKHSTSRHKWRRLFCWCTADGSAMKIQHQLCSTWRLADSVREQRGKAHIAIRQPGAMRLPQLCICSRIVAEPFVYPLALFSCKDDCALCPHLCHRTQSCRPCPQPRPTSHRCPCLPCVRPNHRHGGLCVVTDVRTSKSHSDIQLKCVWSCEGKLCVYVHDTSAVYTMFVCGCSCVGVRCALTRLYLTLERLCGACVRCCDVIPVEGGRGNDS
jgi:hypothetical protein